MRNDAGDGWLLTGQKTWASRGAFAEWCFGIFRTDPEAERHRGLTYFLVAMDSPGVTVRPIPQIDGETGFAEIFFDGVEVPDSQVLGEEGSGWSVAMSTAGQRARPEPAQPGPLHRGGGRLVELFDQHGRPADSADAVARAYIDAEAYRLHTYWTASKVARGHTVGPEASCNKIFWSETDVAIHDTRLDAARPRGRAPRGRAPGRVAGRVPLRTGRAHLRRDERDPAQCRRRTPPRAPAGLTMDFAFDEEQDELRQTVRQALARQFPVAALREFYEATPDARPPSRGPGGPCSPLSVRPGCSCPNRRTASA